MTTKENKPWTRWWWMGGALTEREITRSLERFQAAGFGGIEVSPIYGARGYEERFVPFLSPRWMELFAYTLREAARLELGVDLIAGTGWPFGGPWVTEADAARCTWVETIPGKEAAKSRRKLGALLLVEKEIEGRRYAMFIAPTEQQVKRAAPGGEGNVLDHFDAAAIRRYLSAFDRAFETLPKEARPRCFFNDSWEVYGANITPDFLTEFTRRRGYDLSDHLHHFAGDGDRKDVQRVRSDYRETIHDLVGEVFLKTFADWAHQQHGTKIRNQSHGSPGNLLDLYAAADIPETEVFGPARITLGGMDRYRELPPDFGTEEEALVCRMASSAAHVAGRPLCSSESFTWLGEHGHVPLEQMKAEVDTLFTLGINHIFYHGTPFSPEDAPWPGWLFYATTHCAPTNPFWRDLPALNTYITRCQSLLQSGVPDNDILLYFPFYDLIAAEAGAHDLLQFLTVSRTGTWLRDNLSEFAGTADRLARRGWTFDLVSDRQLAEGIGVDESGGLTTKGKNRYRTILVAGCERMPPETMERLATLAQAGATVLVLGKLPTEVPGLSDREGRMARLRAAEGVLTATGRLFVGEKEEELLAQAGVVRETMTDHGIEFARRRDASGRIYFLANPGTADVRGWIPLAGSGGPLSLLDPMTGRSGLGATRTNTAGKTELFVELPAGGSLLLKNTDASGSPWSYRASVDNGVSLTAGWRVEFITGGATLPDARAVPALSDWTTWKAEDREALRAFSGTARYTLLFDASAMDADYWEIELGQVFHSAHVWLNGHDLGTVLSRPWRVTSAADLLLSGQNRLEIEVTNLMANRLAALEREKGADWRPFLLVNIHYKPFDAATWEPVPSGLVGPVRLIPLRAYAPKEEDAE